MKCVRTGSRAEGDVVNADNVVVLWGEYRLPANVEVRGLRRNFHPCLCPVVDSLFCQATPHYLPVKGALLVVDLHLKRRQLLSTEEEDVPKAQTNRASGGVHVRADDGELLRSRVVVADGIGGQPVTVPWSVVVTWVNEDGNRNDWKTIVLLLIHSFTNLAWRWHCLFSSKSGHFLQCRNKLNCQNCSQFLQRTVTK